jgi:hypothetical protein
MFGTQYFQVRHGLKVVRGEYLACTIAVLGTAMNVDQDQGVTAQSGQMYMTPASGDLLGFLSKNVFLNAAGTVVNPDGTATGTTAVQPSLMAGFPALGGPLASTPVPQMFEQMSTGMHNLPAQVGTAVSLVDFEDADFESEPSIGSATYSGYGQLLVTSGTGAITVSTALETQLSLMNGRWRVAQTGDIIRGILKAQLVPLVATANVRIKIKRENGGAVKA